MMITSQSVFNSVELSTKKRYIYQKKILDEDTRMKLFSFINDNFQSGKTVIYYEALFKEFSDDFL